MCCKLLTVNNLPRASQRKSPLGKVRSWGRLRMIWASASVDSLVFAIES